MKTETYKLYSRAFWIFLPNIIKIYQYHFELYRFKVGPFFETQCRLQIFIQLSPTLTKLCHIKRDYLVHIICSKCPTSAETHAFRRLRKSLIALLIVVCGKSSQICCFHDVNKHVGYGMTSTVTSFAQ